MHPIIWPMSGYRYIALEHPRPMALAIQTRALNHLMTPLKLEDLETMNDERNSVSDVISRAKMYAGFERILGGSKRKMIRKFRNEVGSQPLDVAMRRQEWRKEGRKRATRFNR